MSLIDDLARIRELQGKSPLASPHVIQGFGPDDPPVPPYIAQQRHEAPADEFGIDDDPLPPSPLVPRKAAPVLVAPPGQPEFSGPMPTLVVLDRIASWKGRDVALSEDDEKAVRAVVLRAIQRDLDADLSDAGAKRTRRSRAKAPDAEPAKPKRARKVKP